MNKSGFELRVAELRDRYVLSLPALVAAIAEGLRSRQHSASPSGALDRQFHSLAGTAGTFGLFAIAATATDGFEECASLDGARIEGAARYLWSIVEELEDQVARPRTVEPGMRGHHVG